MKGNSLLKRSSPIIKQTTFGDTVPKPCCDYICLVDEKKCPELRSCKDHREIIKRIRARHTRSARQAIDVHHIDPPRFDDIKTLFYEKLAGDNKCPYCKIDLEIYATREYESLKRAYSLDHIISQRAGGTSKKENLQLICHKCNIVKNAVHPDYFNAVTKCLTDRYGVEGLNRFLDILYKSMFAAAVKERMKNGGSEAFGD